MRKIRGKIYTEKSAFIPGEITFENGTIIDITELSDDILNDEERATLISPGLVDIHSHGCAGHDTCDASVEGLLEMASFERNSGITSFFPATMTMPVNHLEKVMEAVKGAHSKTHVIKGIYFEGPFISKEKCGAQKAEYISKPDYDVLEGLDNISGGLIRFVAIAPELEGTDVFLNHDLSKYRLTVAHSNSDYDTAYEAMGKGANQVTHLYNGMAPYNHRQPGVIGAAMDRDDTFVELIADGIHVAPAVIRNTFRYFGKERIILISDSMEATGMPDGEYMLGGQPVSVTGRKATLRDGIIAGSASTLFDCVREAVRMGVKLEDAIYSASATPAIRAGIFDTVGSLRVGKDADIVVCDNNLNIKCIFSREIG